MNQNLPQLLDRGMVIAALTGLAGAAATAPIRNDSYGAAWLDGYLAAIQSVAVALGAEYKPARPAFVIGENK